MKMRYFFILSAMLLCINGQLLAQSYVESALLFGRTKPGGSARIQALGGSQIALGGDYSSAFSNPAGLGLFNRSEFSITPGLSFSNTKASYFGNDIEESTSRFQLPGMGIVFNIPSHREDGDFIGGSFSISLNRINDFNRSIIYEGNSGSSIIEYFIDQAWGGTEDQFNDNNGRPGLHYNTPTGLSYHNYLIGPANILDPTFPADEYFTDVQNNFEIDPETSFVPSFPNQREEIEIKGGVNQWSFSYGANFKDKFFFGGGIGIGSLRYKAKNTFLEVFDNDPNFSDLVLVENVDISGAGINATLGTIIRPVEFVQLGLSYTTPSYYSLTETYDADLSTNWKTIEDENAFTDLITSDYSLTLPAKLSAGIALISKLGFVTGDIEITNPSKAKYSSDTDGVSFGYDNEDIKSVYKSVVNYRVGAEYRYDIFRVRAGYGVQGSTFKSNIDIDNKITSISGGLGVRLQSFYIDFALINSRGKNIFYQPYSLFDGSGPTAEFKNSFTTGMITIGFTY